MMRTALALASGLLLSVHALGAPSMEVLPAGYIVTDISADGSVMVGNAVSDGSYETFRWTAETGIVRLGGDTVIPIGVGAGTPDVSYDGTRVSATILSADNFATQGVWTLGSGWMETLHPPLPPDGALLDFSYGSAWGLSGDGSTLTGFYWGMGPGSARPNTWSASTGVVSLPHDPGRSCRVNAADFDGDVVVGWEERFDGAWQPTVWRNGVKTRLFESEAFAEAYSVNGAGTVIVGDGYNPLHAKTEAAIWRWNGAGYDMEFAGALAGTAANLGGAWLDSVSDDGQLMAGGNRYGLSPGGNMDGIIWTPDTGLVKDTVWLTSLGLVVPSDWDIRSFTAVSADGRTVTAAVVIHGAEFATVVIRLGSCPADIDGDGVVGFSDLNLLLGNYNMSGAGLAGDIDGDGDVDFSDLNALLGAYNTTCS